MAQRESLAYNGFVIGGTFNAGGYSLLSWAASDDFDTRTVRIAMAVKGTGAAPADRNTRMDLVRGLFQEGSRSLGISTGTSKTITVDVAVSSSTLTLTRTAGDSFAATDLALPIELAGVGAFQISKFLTTSSVECLVPAGVTVPGATTGETATIGEMLVQCADFDKTTDPSDAAASPTGDLGDQVGGVKARPSVGKPADTDDDENRVRFEVNWQFQRPALEVRPDSNGRIRASIATSTSPEGLTGVTFTGTVSAGSVAGRGVLVRAVLSSAIDTWISDSLAVINSGATFEEVGGQSDFYDDEGKVLTFRRVHRQMNINDLDAVVDDPRITGAQVGFLRQYQNVHGIKGARQPFQVTCNYSAGITATGVNAISFTELNNFWGKTIKPYLVGRAKALFGGAITIMGGADPVYDPVSSKIQATIVMFIAKSGSNVFQYDRVTAMDLNERYDVDEIFDQKDYTAIVWTPGKSLTGSVNITVVQIGDPVPLSGGSSGQAGNALAALPGGGLFFSGGALSLSIPSTGIFNNGGNQSGGKAGDASPNSFKAYPDPGNPERLFPGVKFAGGGWVLTDRKATERVQYWGQDPDNQGNRVKVTTLNYIGSYLYLRDRADVKDGRPDKAATGVGSPGGGAKSGTVSRKKGGGV